MTASRNPSSVSSRVEDNGSRRTRAYAVLRSLDAVAYLISYLMMLVAASGALVRDWMRAAFGDKQATTQRRSGRSTPPTSGSSARGGKPRRQRSKAQDAQASQAAVAEDEVYVEKERPETATERRLRALRKKLREIDALQERAAAAGRDLDAAAADKVASKPALNLEIEELRQLAAAESAEARARAAREAEEAAESAAIAEAAAARLAAERAAAADALAKARREALEVIPNVSPMGEATRTDTRLQLLLKQVSILSMDIFDEDCIGNGWVSKKGGWRLSILARPLPEDPLNAPPEEPTELLGFMVFRIRPEMQCLSIAKIAVPKKHRGRGFGKHLMEWSTKHARQQTNLQYLSLSSLPEAVSFYQAFGFRQVKVSAVSDQAEDLIDGQVYMEYRLKGGQRRQG